MPYVAANIPQAWAASAMLWLASSMLGLDADAPNHQLYVQPCLPLWLPNLRLTNLAIGNATVDLRCWREGEQMLFAHVKARTVRIASQFTDEARSHTLRANQKTIVAIRQNLAEEPEYIGDGTRNLKHIRAIEHPLMHSIIWSRLIGEG